MAHIEKRGPGRWRARYRGPDGRERSKTFERRVDAERWLSVQTAAMVRGAWVDPSLGRERFASWAERWWATTASNRPSTRARDASYMRTHIVPVFGDLPLSAISHLDVRSWVAELAARRAPATVQKAYQILAKILGAAVDAGLIVSSPCERIPLPRVEREEMRFLRPDQVAELAATIDARYRALVFVAAYGGLRIGELAALRPERVDRLRGRVEVAEVCVEVSGRLTYGPPKTRAGRRTVALPRPVMAELGDHLERVAGPWVFPAPEGGPLRVPGWRRRQWVPAVMAAGLEPLRPHDLRHTAVALWIAAGANPLEVSRRAGHTSVAFTLDRYGHLFDGADDTLSDRLGALFSPAPPTSAGAVLRLDRGA